ncbi:MULTISPECIES: hypothetical protein [Acetobacter]|uniref:Uncharacterized protein n=2 Tax=Acetobacter TaxID=434 RepID=A0AAN1PK89_9PROT|nr:MULTISPECIES: hypothetical protein [Acetobacter]ASL39285.1 hypothetical protein CBI36_01720 [Acetobacter oryzifermentans]AXN01412.1 hypothetical protein CJF59_13285 [Acetobacter pomorum]KAA8397196.1 hypothetical protein FKW22_05355 [Acetobacter sp. DmW_125124]KAA8397742.1 hypothetical protein FKW20_08785 [Acetobacter sp. DmW_125127]KAA8401145.1 hypothetical protein FKW19_00600 [Acetobacter sp. DmW_125128]
MDTNDFCMLVDDAGRDKDAYVSIDRLRITKEFLEDLCEDSDEIKGMTVADIIDLMEDAL